MINLFNDGLNQMWFNAQKMEVEERKQAIKNIIKSSRHSCGFIEFNAKFLLASLIDNSEPYFNGLGFKTKVKEFEKLGWYDEKGNLDFNNLMKNKKWEQI
jgi:hypothetical protein